MTDSKSLDSDNPNKYFYFKRRVIQLRINYQTTNRSPHLTRLLLNTIPALLFLRRQHSNFTMQHEQAEKSDTVVTWEDQQNINKFSKLNNRFHELEDEIKFAKETNDNLEDAGNELILTDEDIVRFQIGEVFAHVPREEVEIRIEEMKEVNSKTLEKLEKEKETVLAQMNELKKILYGKFRDSINLEED